MLRISILTTGAGRATSVAYIRWRDGRPARPAARRPGEGARLSTESTTAPKAIFNRFVTRLWYPQHGMSNQALPRPRFNAPEPERGSKADLKIETRTTSLLQGKVSEIPDVFFGWAMRLCGLAVVALLALVIAVPLSIGVAVFITEMCPTGLRGTLSFTTELLAAIPSVVYGLWAIFVLVPILRAYVQPFLARTLGWTGLFSGPPYGVGMLAAGVILAIMIIPIISSITREVLTVIPQHQREAVLALGATRWEMIRMGVLRNARAGIVGAIILGLGRARGETMAVTMVIGNRPEIAKSLFAPGYTMASVLA